MELLELKEYLKSLKFGGAQIDSTQQRIVDVAADGAYGKVWGAHVWKIGKRLDVSKTMTSGKAYTILPKGLSGLGTVRVVSGTQSRKIGIFGEDNFDANYPNPSALASSMPYFAKMIYNSDAANDRYRLYWDRIPDSSYALQISYRIESNSAALSSWPGHMLEPIMLSGSVLILPPGPTQNNQMAAAQVSLDQAIRSDEAFVGTVETLGGDPGWSDWSEQSSGGEQWYPR